MKRRFLIPKCCWRLLTGALFLSVIFFDGRTARAQNETAPPVADPSATSEPTNSFADANWFFYLGAGLGKAQYDDTIQSRIDLQKAQGGSSPQVGIFDLPGVYRKIHSGWAAGFVLNMSFEHIARNWRERDSYAVHTYNPSATALYFTGGEVGRGFFVRGDLGPSRLLQVRESFGPDGSVYSYEHSTGVFTQAAVGYGFRSSQNTRILVHLNAFRSGAGSYSTSGLAAFLGFLL